MLPAGTTFISHADGHLWFILSDPVVDQNQILYANFTSYNCNAKKGADNDPACLVSPGEHPFIIKPTCVYYYGAQVASNAHIERRLNDGVFEILHDPLSAALLARIRKCAEKSLYMELDRYQLLVDQGLAA